MQTQSMASKFKESYLPFLKSLAIVIILSPWLVVAYAWITEHLAIHRFQDQQAIQGFIEWFGTAYSFFLALAVVNVWSQFDALDREFDRELDALATMLQTLQFVAESESIHFDAVDKFKCNAREDVRHYIEHVVRYFSSEFDNGEQKRTGNLLLEKIGNRISEVTHGKMILEPYVYELFQSYNDAVDARSDRILHSKPYTPLIIYAVAVVSSLVWLFSFLALVIYDKLFEIILIGGVAFVIIMVLIIMIDLGSPFGGIWKIHLEDWQEFLENMEQENDPRVFFIYNLENTLAGRLRSLVHWDTCRLYALFQGSETRSFGKGFLWRVQRKRMGSTPALHCYTLYNNQLHDYSCVIKGDVWPQVIIKCGLDLVVVLKREQIENCRDWMDFEILFDQEMKKFVTGYSY